MLRSQSPSLESTGAWRDAQASEPGSSGLSHHLGPLQCVCMSRCVFVCVSVSVCVCVCVCVFVFACSSLKGGV